MPHFQASGKDFSAPKIQFEIQIFLFNLTIHCCTPKIGKTYGCIGKLEKKFLLTLVQSAKYYHITRQENLEFLGEFDGGAKITSNSGITSNFEIKTHIVHLPEKKVKRRKKIQIAYKSTHFFCILLKEADQCCK